MRGWRSRIALRAALGAALLAAGLPAGAAEMNISQFVFHDRDRDGVYGPDDRPMAGVPVVLRQGWTGRVTRESNLAGFTNFKMSTDEDEADIAAPGALTFGVQVPTGYELTTGNPEQETEALALDGAPAGIVIDPPLPFVGLAPVLTVESAAEGVAAMTCARGGDTVRAQRAEGRLTCPVAPGRWEIVWEMESGEDRRRPVDIADWPVRVPVPAGDWAPAQGQVTVEDFDGVLSSENIQEMAAGGDGLVWHNMVAVHRKFYGGWGYVNGTVSGQFAAYNSSGHPATLTGAAPFDLVGMFVSVAWPDAMAAPVRIRAYRGDALVGEDAFTASNMRPLWFDAGWRGIDRVVISHDRYWQVVIDDLALARP